MRTLPVHVKTLTLPTQPIGTGFSYGTDPVTSTVSAAEYVWTFLQNFYVAFPEYESRDFGLWTESYGGHYGPEFASYFESQNSAIDAGTVKGEKINLVAVGKEAPPPPLGVCCGTLIDAACLGINNGWIDPALQYQAYPIFAYNNTYNQLINQRQYQKYMVSSDRLSLSTVEPNMAVIACQNDTLHSAFPCGHKLIPLLSRVPTPRPAFQRWRPAPASRATTRPA